MMRAGRTGAVVYAVVLAIAALFWGTSAPAQPVTERAAADSTANPGAAVDAARKRVADGDLAGAVRDLADYVAKHPFQIEPARYLGDLYFRQSDLASAQKTYVAILRYAPDDHESHNRLGGIYAAEDRTQEAIDEFQKSLPSTGAYGNLVELHRRRGDLYSFESSLRDQAREFPSDAAAQFALGSVLRADRQPREGVRYLQRAFDLDPRACSTMAELGSAYLDLDETQQAIDVMQRCLGYEPDYYAALVNIADAYIEESRFPLAHDMLDRAISKRPDGTEALINLGYLADVAQHWQAAVALYLKAIAVDPLERDAYVNLGYDYDEHHLYPLAEAAFLKGLSISPADGRLHYLLGVTYADQGKRDLARVEYQRASHSDEPEVARAAIRDLSLLQ